MLIGAHLFLCMGAIWEHCLGKEAVFLWEMWRCSDIFVCMLRVRGKRGREHSAERIAGGHASVGVDGASVSIFR
ncbi:hypothetical protein KDH_00760 [Dictyobacter sp. S3.2.2.5]|uniref:Secreted protein n=1 Tax=Dictyobacter halimunensis TaxID=3026934 RepID=A0ABQ6FI35_9CHLR|nr:hypothetical protein KDH_00760 [Dictyobacter sp. S3.2.2.5]